ncbi:hypothetical protein WM40_25805 [Robbsia andropogonis]|uniref:Uncharacterized protein n=1 Tax=Robbsia andropogonis TaxID=28092 RepID=A0A0F5JT67_9BURK|nr:hypothetical protein WM40_25805 [Robbsia andropogonis]
MVRASVSPITQDKCGRSGGISDRTGRWRAKSTNDEYTHGQDGAPLEGVILRLRAWRDTMYLNQS